MQEVFEGNVATITVNVIVDGDHTAATIDTSTTRLSTHPFSTPTVTTPSTGVYKIKFSGLNPALSVDDNDDGLSCAVNGSISGTAWTEYHVPLKVSANMRGTDNASTFDHTTDEVVTDAASRTASQATGFSVHSAADVVTALQAVANDFKADTSSLASQSSVDVIDSIVDAIKLKTDQLAFTVAGQVDANALTGGSSLTASDVYTEFTSGSNADAFKADVSTLATQASVDTVDSNVDAILLDTNELQLNQGDWATATGFSTHSSADVVSGLQAVSADFKADVSSLLTTASYNASIPSNFSTLLIGTGADAGKVTTSNPASGGGSLHTAQDVADLILANPSNLLVTNATGQVETSNASGGTTASEVVTAMQAVANDFKADVSGVSTFDHTVDTVTTDSASREASKATGFSTHSSADVASDVWDQSHSSHTISGSFGAHLLLSTNQNHEVQITGSNHIAADVHEFQDNSLTADATDATFVAEVGGSGSGGATAQEVYDLFTSGTNEDAFKADTTLLAKSSELAQLAAGGTGLNQITVRVQDALGNALQGAKINIDDTVISLITPVSGEVIFNLDFGSSKFDVLPPAGYDTPASQTLNVTGDGTVIFTLSESSTSTGGSVNWIG